MCELSLSCLQSMGSKLILCQLVVRESFGPMASQLESEPHFAERARSYGVSDALLLALQHHGLRALGASAFAVFRPGADFDEGAFDARPNNAFAPTMGQMAALRRLHFEAEVVTASSLKASAEIADHTAPKPVPDTCLEIH